MTTALPITTEQQAAQHMRDHQALLCVHHIAKTFPGMDGPVVDDVSFGSSAPRGVARRRRCG